MVLARPKHSDIIALITAVTAVLSDVDRSPPTGTEVQTPQEEQTSQLRVL